MFVRGSGLYRPLVRARVSVGSRCRSWNPQVALDAPKGGLRDFPCYPSMRPFRISIGTPSEDLIPYPPPYPEVTFRFPLNIRLIPPISRLEVTLGIW